VPISKQADCLSKASEEV